MKRCSSCQQTKSLDEFNKKTSNKDGLERYCKSCHRLRNRKHYETNKQSYIDSAMRQRIKITAWYKDMKGQLKCELCPEDHVATLDFHHTDPSQKLGLVSMMARSASKKKLLAEIAKCRVLCSNCHRKIHYTGVV
jgi:hypothetical protein